MLYKFLCLPQKSRQTMKRYPSKVNYVLLSIVLIVLIGSSLPLVSPPMWTGLIINILLLVLVIHLFSSTYYLIEREFLIVKSGFIINEKIDINLVKSIKETGSMQASPALSFDRLEVNWEKYTGIIVSPKKKNEFIEHMLSINPHIDVQLKK